MNERTARAAIIDLSHEFGTPDYVKGGGGNTSVKTGDLLWIKPSGTTLESLTAEKLVPMNRSLIHAVFAFEPPPDASAREELVKNLLQAAVTDAACGRPSVETPLHEILNGTFVVHTHPPLVNGMTCAARGAEEAARLFPEALWVSYTDPGYTLAVQVRDKVDRYAEEHGQQPAIIFLENHGVFVSGNTPDEIRAHYHHVIDTLAAAYRDAGVATELKQQPEPDAAIAAQQAAQLRQLLGTDANGVSSSSARPIATGPLTPDHMVYAKAFPFTDPWTKENLRTFTARRGYAPRVFSCEEGLFTAGQSQAKADLAMALALDGALVIQLTHAFGGPQFLDDAARQFIESWEVESYRERALGSQA